MPTENINPIVFLSPLFPVVASIALIIAWWLKRSFRLTVFLFALAAYSTAIIAKYIFQGFTAASAISYFGPVSPAIAFYYGAQTSIFEVGLAYAIALYAVRRGAMRENDAGAFGISLSFWENGVLLGIFPLINLLSAYLIIAYGGTGLSAPLRDAVMSSQPSLFWSTGALLPSIGYSALERTSSILAHYSWGFLAVVSAARRKAAYFLIALPMGLIDALVPYAQTMGLRNFELTIFALSLAFLAIAVFAGRHEKISSNKVVKGGSPPSAQ